MPAHEPYSFLSPKPLTEYNTGMFSSVKTRNECDHEKMPKLKTYNNTFGTFNNINIMSKNQETADSARFRAKLDSPAKGRARVMAYKLEASLSSSLE